MPWFPVDDAFHSHPKARKAGLEALGLWTISGSFCMAYLTDGFVPSWFVKERPRGAVLAKRLVDAGLWRVGEHEGEQGFWFHQWKPECTKSHVLDMREKARLRKSKSRESRVTDSVTDAEPDVGVLGFNQTNPNQPKPLSTSVVNQGGEVTQVAAHGPPAEFCSKHPNGTDDPCRSCGRARKARETWEADHQQSALADEITQRRQAKERADNCPTCHGSNWIPDTDPAIKCTHDQLGDQKCR